MKIWLSLYTGYYLQLLIKFMKKNSLFLVLCFVFSLGLSSCHEFTSMASELLSSDGTNTFIFPAPLGSVSDYEKILTGEQIRELDSLIILHEKRTKNKISIVTTRSIKPYNALEEYSSDLFSGWRVGGDKENGILIVYSEKLNEVRITQGNGLKKRLTDKECKRIIKKIMLPKFEEEGSFAGLKSGLKEIIIEIK